MCGILGILDVKGNIKSLRQQSLNLVWRLRHRGTDWSGINSDNRAILCHERLAIVDVMSGSQPLINSEKKTVLGVNGEIYYHKELCWQLKRSHPFQTESDCEVILYLYDEYGAEFFDMLNDIFAFILWNPQKNDFLIVRDHIGIVPLYIGWDTDNTMYVASELKAMADRYSRLEEFPRDLF